MASSRPCRGVGGWGPATGHSEGLRRTPFLLLSLNPSVRFALSRPRGRFLSVHSTRSADPADFQCPGPSPTRVWPLGGVPELVSLRPPPLWDRRPFSCPRLPPESVPFLTPEPVTGTASVGCSRMVRKHIAHSLRGFEWIQSLFSVLCANAFERAGTHSGGCCLTDRSRWWALMKGMLVQVIPAARGPHTTGYC